ncbi:DUF4175 family protein [Reichenbachiella ulvae]|uniref:DUF4175 domain-containing protein n=1 Tax=Reichenbachiella ulvae TaxID=2980104 RepID=A0ABT3CXB2_9BACT|nr:DUF4175 family protein [Reichenbachiella ulvae]MCV9388331.1 hypothetical protein [Reichenbachiella ulvae]
MIGLPLVKYALYERFMSDEEAARQIGEKFSDIGDKVLNTIQLNKGSKENALINASLEQRISELSIFEFSSGINFKTNLKYLKYLLFPSMILLTLLLVIPQFITESTSRIINYNTEYSESLFDLKMITDLKAFRNEPLKIELQLTGSAIPDKFYLASNGNSTATQLIGNKLVYTFPKVKEDFDFYLYSGSFRSEDYQVTVYNRPEVKNLKIRLDYPNYTRLKSKQIENNGNLTLPEGTKATWELVSTSSDQINLIFTKDTLQLDSKNDLFYGSKVLSQITDYEIQLANEHSLNKEPILYHVDIVKDKYPEIDVNVLRDTTLYQFLLFEGNIADDYGFQRLELHYELNSKRFKQNVSINRSNPSQPFFCQLNLDSLDLNQGDVLNYYLSIRDNDEINGYKETRTPKYSFRIPDKSEINDDIKKSAEHAKSEMSDALKKSEEVRKQIDDIQQDLKKQNNNNWQEKKKVNQLIENKEELEKEINKLLKEHKELTEKQNKFHKPNKELQEKAQQLQKLMDEMLDEETKKLYEELKKLLEEQNPEQNLDQLMDDLSQKEKNLQDELERALEMFKRMQFEYKMDEIVQELEKTQKKQESLSNQTKDKNSDLDQIKKDQEEINEEFDQIKEEMNQMEEMNQDLKQPENLEDMSSEKESIDQTQEEISEQLEQNKRKKSSEKQQDAADQMKQLQQKMQNMQAGMEMEMMQENLDNLRNILDNLLTLSFDQEQLMKSFEEVNQSDPRFVSLSQKQLKLRDDAVIIDDSLKSLASRVFQIQSFVTRELNEMNKNIEASLQSLKDRKKSEAISNQQYTMTAINNLSLLLNDVLKQMQEQMAMAMGMPKKGEKGKNQPKPNLSQLQQELNNKIEQLKKSGKSGRPLSKELAEMAAQQEMIRKQLEEIQNNLNDANGGKEGLSKNLQEIIKKMEESETDLVNKNIKQETIKRQQDILTRMLESEDALRERELDQKREAETAKDRAKQSRKEFEEYIKAKESELELLQTLPPKMNPYYKEEVNKYFERLNEQ